VDRAKWVPRNRTPNEREQVEKLTLSRINTFMPLDWIGATKQERAVAFQAFENRVHKMQGRETFAKIEFRPLKKDVYSILDLESNTITISEALLESSRPKFALAQLFKRMHELMQIEAIKNPKAFQEHGLKNIQSWAEPKDGKPSYGREAAIAYAIRQTEHLD
jgi:hypothetical protein